MSDFKLLICIFSLLLLHSHAFLSTNPSSSLSLINNNQLLSKPSLSINKMNSIKNNLKIFFRNCRYFYELYKNNDIPKRSIYSSKINIKSIKSLDKESDKPKLILSSNYHKVTNSRIKEFDNILLVDDINDSGKTLKTVYDLINGYSKIIYNATLIYNQESKVKTDFYGKEIRRSKDQNWYVFPWEEW